MVSEWLLALFCWRDSMRSTYVLLGLGGMLLLLDATLVRNNNCIKNWIQICALFHELAYIMTCNLNQTRISEPWRKFNQSYKKSVYICVHLSSVKSIKISHINFGTLKSWVLFDTKNSILFVSLLRGGGWSNSMQETGSDHIATPPLMVKDGCHIYDYDTYSWNKKSGKNIHWK